MLIGILWDNFKLRQLHRWMTGNFPLNIQIGRVLGILATMKVEMAFIFITAVPAISLEAMQTNLNTPFIILHVYK